MIAQVSRLAGMALLTLATVAAFAQVTANPVTTNGSQVFLTGYVQPRFTVTNGETGTPAVNVPSNFDVKRMYLVFGARLDPRISGQVTLSGFPGFGVLEAYGAYTNGRTVGRLGIVGTPYGYEAGLSSSRLITTERSKAIQEEVYSRWAFDRGVYVYRNNPGKRVSLAAGLTNGTPMVAGLPGGAADANNQKNFVARAGYPIAGGSVGANLYDGKDNTGALLNRWGLDLRSVRTGRTRTNTIISEIIQAKDGAVKKNGGYVTLATQRTGQTLQPYVRFDVFDPNTAAGGDYYKRWTVGANKFLSRVNPVTKIQLEFEAIDDKLDPALDSRVTLQYQVGF